MKVRFSWNLHDVVLEIPSNEKHQREFRIVSEEKSFCVKAKSEKDRNDWIEAIEQAIVGLKDVITRPSTEDTNETFESRLESTGDIEPVFFPPSMAQFCQVQDKDFY